MGGQMFEGYTPDDMAVLEPAKYLELVREATAAGSPHGGNDGERPGLYPSLEVSFAQSNDGATMSGKPGLYHLDHNCSTSNKMRTSARQVQTHFLSRFCHKCTTGIAGDLAFAAQLFEAIFLIAEARGKTYDSDWSVMNPKGPVAAARFLPRIRQIAAGQSRYAPLAQIMLDTIEPYEPEARRIAAVTAAAIVHSDYKHSYGSSSLGLGPLKLPKSDLRIFGSASADRWATANQTAWSEMAGLMVNKFAASGIDAAFAEMRNTVLTGRAPNLDSMAMVDLSVRDREDFDTTTEFLQACWHIAAHKALNEVQAKLLAYAKQPQVRIALVAPPAELDDFRPISTLTRRGMDPFAFVLSDNNKQLTATGPAVAVDMLNKLLWRAGKSKKIKIKLTATGNPDDYDEHIVHIASSLWDPTDADHLSFEEKIELAQLV